MADTAYVQYMISKQFEVHAIILLGKKKQLVQRNQECLRVDCLRKTFNPNELEVVRGPKLSHKSPPEDYNIIFG